jgi:5-methylcytosine-specific restriction endonuclease McrA
LTTNHIDGDSENHRPENLELLCGGCHSLTPHYGKLNNGHGRKRRREKLQREMGM